MAYKNKEDKRRCQCKYRERNRDKINMKARECYERNKEKISREQCEKRKAKKNKQKGE